MALEFRILGPVEVCRDGNAVDIGSPRQRALLARLLINPGEVISADRLVDDLWSGDPPASARHGLHVYVSGLRKALDSDGGRLESVGTGYRLSLTIDELDASRFESLAKGGRDALARGDAEGAAAVLREALESWRGPALADVRDEAFAQSEAARLDELRLAALEHRIWADIELGRHRDLVEELSGLVTQHPFREILWEQLMLSLYRSGRQTAALREFQNARSKLAEELGIDPGPALQRMERRILAHDPDLDHASAEPSPAPAKLPVQRTSFVGRERDLERASELLADSRMLTLTGAPGSGKTRLALRLASDHQVMFPHGAFFVPLAEINSPRLVAGEILRALELREVDGETPMAGIGAYLRDRKALLVLDNFEHVIRAAPIVGEVLDAAPQTKVIVTSRQSLGLSGEQEFVVAPLDVPSEAASCDPEELLSCDAVALFAARARAVDSNFEVDVHNGSSVADITIRVDGLPLAIELAAARVKLLSPLDLLERLDKRLSLLTAGPLDSSDRHRTMRNAIEWSHDLLAAQEKALFARLGTFLGGFTLEAAAAIADVDEATAFAVVDSLLSKSLLYRPVGVGRARFAMLEMMREYALDQLEATGELDTYARRHAEYFLRLAREVEPDLTSDPGRGIERLAPEVGNLRRALRWSLISQEQDLGIELGSRIWRFWHGSGQLNEGRQWLAELLEDAGSSPDVRAEGLVALAGLAYWQADYDTALTLYEEALELFRALDDRYNEAETLCNMALTTLWKREVDEGDRLAQQALAIFQELGHGEVGNVRMAQGTATFFRGDLAKARALWEEVLASSRKRQDHALALTQVVGLAAIVFNMGDEAEALRILIEGLDEATSLHNDHITVWMLDFLAAIAAKTYPEAAVRLAGAVDNLRREAGGGIRPADIYVEDARSVGSQSLSPETLEAEWTRGRTMTLREAIREADRLTKLLSGVLTTSR